MSEKPKILAIVGPTASGKTALSIALAHALDGEIVSADSMQIYRGMDIGTAKPSMVEREGIPHHLIDIADPDEAFSVADYITYAERAVQDILSRGKLPILCGGTGLYLDAFLRGGLTETPGANERLREELYDIAKCEGEDALHAMLAEVDPESAVATHKSNVRRVVRALEIYRLTGVTKTEWDRRSREIPTRYNAAVICLSFTDRALLYERIERRVDAMLADGLLDETQQLLDAGVFERSSTAAAAIGYKELLPYFAGACTLDDAVVQLKTATRRYAKRQLTWFLAKDYVRVLPVDEHGNVRKSEEIVNNAINFARDAWHML